MRAARRGACVALAIGLSALVGSAIDGSTVPAPHHSPAVPGLSALPAPARAAVAQRLGAADPHFWARRRRAGATFRDGGSGIDAQVSRRGATVRVGTLSWSLGLRAVGRGERLEPMAAATLAAHANQVTLQRAPNVQERYDYGPLGLEQGFRIGARPSGSSLDALVLSLGDTPRGVDGVVAPGGRSLSLERSGRTLLRYWGLFASDARGHPLPVRIVIAGKALSVRVDDRGAVYPIRVDPFVQVAKLTASDAAANDEVGFSVAVSGDTVVVGDYRATVGNNGEQGAVYVFVKPANGWASAHEVAKLTASDGATNDMLGWSVAISGDTVLAGAPGANSQQGAAYVFAKPNGGWASEHEAAKLTNAAGRTGDSFGFSVALSTDTAVVGVPTEGNGVRQQNGGSVYVFAKPPAGWGDSSVPTAHLTASDGVVPDQVGYSVAIDGDTIVAGAEHEDIGANSAQGALYVFVKPAGGWADGTETKKLTASDGSAFSQLGYSVGIMGDTIAAGAPSPSGGVYVFVRPASGWANADGTETAKLTPSDPSGSGFGDSTAISGDTIVAGAPNHNVGNSTNQGKLYVFVKPGAGWASGHETQQLTASDGAPHDQLGFSVGISGPTIAAGAPLSGGTGAGYVFTSGAAGGGEIKRPTSTSVASCLPPAVAVGSSATCRATVTDTGGGPAVAPTGSVRFASDSHGTFAGASCTLTAVDATSSRCSVVYTPTAVDSGTHTLAAAYGGDALHDPSSGRGTLTVRPAPPPSSGRPLAPPQNIAPPSIAASKSCQLYNGRPYCQTIPYEYDCYPGLWAGNDPATPFQYEWDQLYYMRQGAFLSPFWRAEPHGSNQTFYAAAPKLSPFDIAHGIIASGAYRCRVTASGRGGSTTADSPAKRLQVAPSLLSGVPRPAPVDIHVTGIEVTQGVQEAPCGGCVFSDPSHLLCETCGAGTLPSRDQSSGDTPGDADYTGVTMSAGKQTVVRVFANVTRVTGSLTGATAQLEVLDAAHRQLAVLNPAVNEFITPGPLKPPSPACPLCVDLATRANPSSSYYFLIPAAYTNHRSLSFRATVSPQVAPLLPGQCGGCRGNVFTLDDVPFKQAATVTILPIPLDDEGIPNSPRTGLSLNQIFGALQTVFPNPVRVLPWDGTLDVEGLGTDDAAEAVEDRAEDADVPSSVYPVGVFFRGESGGLGGTTPRGPGRLFTDDGPPVSIVGDYRPLTMAAHEVGHGMALGHADDAHPHPDGSANCGGDSNGQQGEGWPPDYEGRIQGVGLDLRGINPLRPTSLPATYVEGFDHKGKSVPGTKYFDFMSYCPPPPASGLGSLVGPAGGFPPLQQFTETSYWLSPHNWQRLLDYHAPAQTLPPSADRTGRAAAGTPLRVIATVQPGGATTIHDVTPGQHVRLRPTPGSPFRIQLRDSTGKVLASVVPATITLHTDGVTRQGLMLAATLPLTPGAAAVVVTGGGQDLARRKRSAHAPVGRFVSPRRGARVGRTRITVVRWSEHDADGDRLTSDVDYSANGGHSWRVVAGRMHGTSARIPSRLLSASRNARLRVRISDGFNLTTVTSGRFRATGAPPEVQIVGATRRARVLQTALLSLQGAAYDDAGRPLTGRHLTWYLGKRRLGHGEFATAGGLPAGNTEVRLVATDSHGRRAQAILPVRVKAVAARYLLFDAPLLISRQARAVKIRIAASGPATFTIAGKRYAVGPRLRTITVRIPRGKQPVRLRCSLRSAGGVVKATYIAVRR